jgi:hypothetical protein
MDPNIISAGNNSVFWLNSSCFTFFLLLLELIISFVCHPVYL